MDNTTIYEQLETAIKDAKDISAKQKQLLFQNLLHLKKHHVNILITGATGCGKSSTINALFNTEKAKIGVGVNPETMDIERYELGNMILWDSPGLGDGKEADNRHARNIISKLTELDSNGKPLIDLVLVILDGSSRDMGTSYQLINEVIIPHLGKDESKRLLVAINQADMAMKGRGWDIEKNEPQPILQRFLEEKVRSVKRRIKEATGVDVNPIFYSAGFKEEGGIQQAPYNLSKLMYLIVQATPEEKRIIYVDTANKKPEMWAKDDNLEAYREKTWKDVVISTTKTLGSTWAGAEIGGAIGMMVAGPIGGAVGTVVGGVIGFFTSLF